MLIIIKICGGSKLYGVEVVEPQQAISSDCAVILGVNKNREKVYEQVKRLSGINVNIFDPCCEWWIGKYNQYFDEDILKPSEGEIFVDAGAFDGNDSRKFIEWSRGQYKHIYAFEPDKLNYEKMLNCCKGIENMTIESVGLLDKKMQIRFKSGKKENSMIDGEGNEVIDTVSLDDYLKGNPITFLKMDIEGSEYLALEGAKHTIEKHTPKLAICVYHKPEDIIDIPLKILDIDNDYVFFLRHYSYLNTETVLYAVNKRQSGGVFDGKTFNQCDCYSI